MAKRFTRSPVDLEVIAERRRRLAEASERVFGSSGRVVPRTTEVSKDLEFDSPIEDGTDEPDEDLGKKKKKKAAANHSAKLIAEYESGEFLCDHRHRRFAILDCINDYRESTAFEKRENPCCGCRKGRSFREIFSES